MNDLLARYLALPFQALLLLLALSRSACAAPGEEGRAPARGPSLRIAAATEKVYRGGEVSLRAIVSGASGLRYRWRASAGELLSDDLPQVVWHAPPRVGAAELAVEVWVAGADANERPLRARRNVNLLAPSTQGMVRIPGGIVTIGDTWTDVDHPEFIRTQQNKADKPPHRVQLTPYYIDVDRVTNLQYASFLEEALESGSIEITPVAVFGRPRLRGGTGSRVPFYRFSYDDMPQVERLPRLRRIIRWNGSRFVIRRGYRNHPVVDVTWAGADAYARHHGKRLPTSAEWELAARGKDGRRFPWGDELPTPLHANVNGYYGSRVFPVSSFSPLGDSPYGVHDMLGGIFEWTHDWYNEDYYEDVAAPEPLVDPRGPHWGKDHVIRGADAKMGFVGGPFEQPPLSFRYQWLFEFPAIGVSVATFDTGFRTAVTDPAWVDRHGEKTLEKGAAAGRRRDGARTGGAKVEGGRRGASPEKR